MLNNLKMNPATRSHIAPSSNYTIYIDKQFANSEMPSLCSNNQDAPKAETKGTTVNISDHSLKIIFGNDGSANHTTYVKTSCDFSKMKEELYQLVVDGKYDDAVELAKTLKKTESGLINDTVQKLLESHSTGKNLISYAFKLWNAGAKDIVRTQFPAPFKLIFEQGDVKIVNQEYTQALKLDRSTDSDNDRLAWGDSKDKTSKRVSWQILPIWENNQVTFRIYNGDCKMYLKCAVAVNSYGDRRAYGSPNSDTDKHRFFLEPYMKDGVLVFFIINFKYNQGLKLVVAADNDGDRALMGHNSDIYSDEGRFRWIISTW